MHRPLLIVPAGTGRLRSRKTRDVSLRRDPRSSRQCSRGDSPSVRGGGPSDLTNPSTARPASGAKSRGIASYAEFAAALTEIGLIDSAELARFAVDCAEDVVRLSRALIKAGRLTPYQAAAIYQNKSRGLLIGNYLILDKVGQGGMGMVFKARHRKLGRLGALKILPPSFTRNYGEVMRFRREFEAAGRLKHLNLVAAFEADEDRGVHFLVMDYVEGINLERVIREHGPLPVSDAVDYLIQSARGLEPRTKRESFIAISSPAISCSTAEAQSACSTWASPGSSMPAIPSASRLPAA